MNKFNNKSIPRLLTSSENSWLFLERSHKIYLLIQQTHHQNIPKLQIRKDNVDFVNPIHIILNFNNTPKCTPPILPKIFNVQTCFPHLKQETF